MKSTAILFLGLVAGFLIHSAIPQKISLGSDIDAKPEWSALQSIELTHRQTRIESTPKIEVIGEFKLIGLRQKNGSNMWILANPQSTPLIKRMPSKSDPEITLEEFFSIVSTVELKPEVAEFLVEKIDRPNQAVEATAYGRASL